MKRLLCVLLLLAMLSPAALAETEYYGTMIVEHCDEWVSLREGPSTSRKRLAKVPLHALVTDAQWSPAWGDDFIRCTYEGKTGYILSEYLEFYEDETEKEPENDGETRFVSDNGFWFFYDPAVLRVDTDASEDGQSVLVEALDTDAAVYLEMMTPDSLGLTPEKYLMQNETGDGEYEVGETEYGAQLKWFRAPYKANADIVNAFYAVEDGEKGLVAVGTWPAKADEKWAELFTELMRTVGFAAETPLRADWAEATPNALVVDADGEYVTLMSEEHLTQVSLLALELGGSEGALFNTTEIAQRESITPENPFVLKIAFPGDFPDYGIRFTDEKGTVYQYAIVVSGRDGQLELESF